MSENHYSGEVTTPRAIARGWRGYMKRVASPWRHRIGLAFIGQPGAPHSNGSASSATRSEEQREWAVASAAERAIVDEARPYTLTSFQRILAAMDAVEHVVARGIEGAIVECGVWRGGSVLAMMRTLQRLGVDDREVYLYDTFDGMTEPSEYDTSPFDEPAIATWARSKSDGRRPWDWAFDDEVFDVEQVRNLLWSTGYPPGRIHFVTGRVEDTLPRTAPSEIAVLRLDTDWYESTRHEMDHLFPRLAEGGVLIVDDYGHWEGARRAVDEYLEQSGTRLLLARIDYTGRMGVKH